jgi:hypothetical protein
MHHHKSRASSARPGICPARCSTPGADVPEPGHQVVSAPGSARAKAKDTTKHNGGQLPVRNYGDLLDRDWLPNVVEALRGKGTRST